MVSNKAIVIEDRLKEIFDYLPDIVNDNGESFKPVFMYGDDKQLTDFLRQSKTHSNPYPLIWLTYPFVEKHKRSRVEFKDMTLVLAVESNSSMLNDQRLIETYSKVLIPLLDNIRTAFHRCNIINLEDEYRITKYPNYSYVYIANAQDVNLTNYIWDALKISIDGYITSNCLKPINFN